MAKINLVTLLQNTVGNGKNAVVGLRTGTQLATDLLPAILSPGHRSMPSYPAPADPDARAPIATCDAVPPTLREACATGLSDSESLATVASQTVAMQRFAGVSMAQASATRIRWRRCERTATKRIVRRGLADRQQPRSAFEKLTLSRRGPR